MKGLWLTQGALTLIAWFIGLFAVFFLLKSNRKDKNPLEWPLSDRCMLITALFCFLSGAGNAVIGIGFSANLERLPWIDINVIQSYYLISRMVVVIWIFLLFLGLFLRKRMPENRAFAHMVVQYDALHVTLVCYAFGSVSHPGPFLLAMALGTLNFLLFDRRIALLWIATFILLTVILTLFTFLGAIPYAPIYASAPFGGGRIEGFYFLGTSVLVIMVFC
jgi:hypothetical protein